MSRCMQIICLLALSVLICLLPSCAAREKPKARQAHTLSVPLSPEQAEASRAQRAERLRLLELYRNAVPPDAAALPELTPEDVTAAFARDRGAASEEYTGKWIKVRGKLIIGPSPDYHFKTKDFYQLCLAGEEKRILGFLFYGPENLGQLDGLKRGQTLVIMGVIPAGSYSPSSGLPPELFGCRVISVE